MGEDWVAGSIHEVGRDGREWKVEAELQSGITVATIPTIVTGYLRTHYFCQILN